MKHNLTELVFILDRSGSMSGLEKDTIGGFNSLIEKQKKEEGEAYVSLVLFNDSTEILLDHINLNEVKELTGEQYYAFGMTAMLDAIGNTINQIRTIHQNLAEEEKPAKTLFVITTDGLENASTEFSYRQINQLINKTKEEGFEYLFLGANVDAKCEASKMGIKMENAVNYNCDEDGIDICYGAVHYAISEMRTKGMIEEEWCTDIEEDFVNRPQGSSRKTTKKSK